MIRSTALFSALFLYSQVTYAGTAVDVATFFQGIHGGYDIVTAGGKPPKVENSVADVYADADAAYFTMPYCKGDDLCEPGLNDFPHANTKVEVETLNDGTEKHTITLEEKGKTKTFYWSVNSGTVTLRDPQRILDDGVTEMEHVLTKQAAPPPETL